MVAPALLAALLQGWLPAVRFMPASIVEAVARVSPARLQLDCAPENLPADTLIMQEENPNVWLDETLEYSGLRDDPHTPHALRGYLCSFKLPSGIGCHAFKGGGVPLGKYIGQGGSSWDSDDRFTDTERLRLVMDLLDAVNHLHCRGCPHLDLTVDSIIVRKTADGCAGIAPIPAPLARTRQRKEWRSHRSHPSAASAHPPLEGMAQPLLPPISASAHLRRERRQW
jgi:hypothetical protein